MGNKAIKLKDKNNNTFYPCPYYPIGSIYMNANNVNPREYFGGTWEQIKDVFLLCAGDKYAAGSIGGEAEVTLAEIHIPPHKHVINGSTANSGGYSMMNLAGNAYSGGATGHSTSNTGGGQAHNNMPPYKTIYVWQRIA